MLNIKIHFTFRSGSHKKSTLDWPKDLKYKVRLIPFPAENLAWIWWAEFRSSLPPQDPLQRHLVECRAQGKAGRCGDREAFSPVTSSAKLSAGKRVLPCPLCAAKHLTRPRTQRLLSFFPTHVSIALPHCRLSSSGEQLHIGKQIFAFTFAFKRLLPCCSTKQTSSVFG